jgi:anti-sigma factor (TIGR02949 family)
VIPCKEAVTRLWEYLDRTLGKVSETELEEHLGLCRHCCGELEFARQVRGLLGKTGRAAALSDDVRSRLETFVKGLGRAKSEG